MEIEKALTVPPDYRCHKRLDLTQTAIWKKCSKCVYSEIADSHPACMYMDLDPEHKRRPVPAADCAAEKPGSVFKPRKRSRWSPAQAMAFTSRGV